MPTRAEFEAAADKFTTAAYLVDQLVTAAASAGAAQILRGGSLGRQVPQRIEAAQHTARTCHQTIIEAADTCIERAEIIADYETLLAKYDISYGYFERASKAWAEEFNAWFLDETGTIEQPRDAPHPPSRPTPPPDWAEVRRP